MTRRLRIAGTAFSAMLVPACAGLQPDPPTIKPVNPPIPTAARERPMSGPPTSQTAKPKTVEKFAVERPDAAPTVAHVPTPAVDPPPRTEVAQVEHRTNDAAPSPVYAPRLVRPIPSGEPTIPPAEPVPDAEGVIRTEWPVIKGLSSAPDALTPTISEPKVFTPMGDAPPPLIGPVGLPTERSALKADSIPAALVPQPVIPPAAPGTLPPGVIGSSIHQSHASPAGAASVEVPFPAEITPANAVPQPGESPLILAVRAFQQNRPDEAVEYLKAYDSATQQVFLALMPTLVRLSDGKLQQMKAEEMDVVLDQLNRVPSMLRPRASLLANNVRLCREVHNFAHVEPFPDRHVFHPGDIVYLYMELANFSPMPSPKGGYLITLVSSLEMRDSAGGLVWRADPKEVPDHVLTPPQDYYRNFRLSIPTVPPGTYTLVVKSIDRPTGREVRKSVELRIGAR